MHTSLSSKRIAVHSLVLTLTKCAAHKSDLKRVWVRLRVLSPWVRALRVELEKKRVCIALKVLRADLKERLLQLKFALVGNLCKFHLLLSI